MAGYRATYNDGRTAARHEVTVSFDLDGLRIADPGGQAVAVWPYQDLEHLDEVFEGRGLRLRVRPDDGARLALPDRSLLDDLVARAPQLRVRRRGWGRQAVRWAGLSVTVVAVLCWC